MTDLIVIGAGPAGMSAAITAARGGAKVLLLDENPGPGGKIYRNVTRSRPDTPYLGPEYQTGLELAQSLDHPNLGCAYGSTVWRVEAGPRVTYSQHGQSRVITARHVLIATGAQERPMPFPGWSLPGVMLAGGAQVLMKTSGLLPRDAVLAGSGPLLYLVAAQMIAAGQPPKALVETQTARMAWQALRHLPRALLDRQMLFKGLGLLRAIRKAGIPRYKSATGFHVEQAGSELAFSFTCRGQAHRISCALLLCHQGVVPATHLTRSAGIGHDWNAAQQCWQHRHDDQGRSDLPGLWVAGDGAGIFGADAARAQGVITANAILGEMDNLRPDVARHVSAHAVNTLFRAKAIRAYLDIAYAPLPEFLSPGDDTILCRCEEITAGTIRETAQNGAAGPRQLKTATRAGMGPCQGRMCELSLTTTLSALTGEMPQNIGPHRARSPSKPISLGELANLDLGD